MTVADLMDYLASFSPVDELEVEVRDTVSQACLDTTYDIALGGNIHYPSLVVAVEAQKFEHGI